MYPTNTSTKYYYSAENDDEEPLSTMATFTTNGDTLVDDYTTLNKDYFLGVKFDGSGNITNAYACGIKGENPNNGTAFCIEGSTDGSTHTANSTFLNDSTTGLWQGGCDDDGSNVVCYGSASAFAYSNGNVGVLLFGGRCYVYGHGSARCY